MARFRWNGPAAKRLIESEMTRRISAACVYLTSQVKADISQPGTLRYSPATKSGKPSKRQKTIYNFTHSLPGNPPYKQTGQLRRSIAWEVVRLVGRVGSNMPLARWLELGTGRMAARPFLRANLHKHAAALKAIIAGRVAPGGLPGVKSNQFRSGRLGAGAKEAGYD